MPATMPDLCKPYLTNLWYIVGQEFLSLTGIASVSWLELEVRPLKNTLLKVNLANLPAGKVKKDIEGKYTGASNRSFFGML